jgi:DNA-entry nuclease
LVIPAIDYAIISEEDHDVKFQKNVLLSIFILLFTGGALTACGSDESHPSATHSSQVRSSSQSSEKAAPKTHHQKHHASAKTSPDQHHEAILSKLISYTDKESAGPTGDYYWVNGKAHFTKFAGLEAGDYRFGADSQGRSATARAVLTYTEYEASRGSRQGEPLDPPAWPENKIVAISYGLTGRTYHGYLYNKSHSIGDSLLGTKSYTSEYNFTTGTRPQNVGADQNGGMRFAEESAENYWESYPGTHHVIYYQTTPLYKGNETMPRGSIVDVRSSDKTLNTEIVVINSAEGIRFNYSDGTNNAKTYVRPHNRQNSANTRSTNSGDHSHQTGSTHTDGPWTVAASGMVFVSDTNKYYSEVKNPNNYQYESQSQANASGAIQASRGNQYARP